MWSVDFVDAFCEEIDGLLKLAQYEVCKRLTDEMGCHYVGSGATAVSKVKRTKSSRKLLIFDNFGNQYPVGGCIANHRFAPLILLESRFSMSGDGEFVTRVCCAHEAIRQRYQSVRASIAIMAGNWSKSSITTMESHNFVIFFIPFNAICDALAEFDIDIRWSENEREKVSAAWGKYNQLTIQEQIQLGQLIVQPVIERLSSQVTQILDDPIVRTVDKVVIELVSNLGEVKLFEFTSVEEALEFLEQEGLEDYFVADDSLTLFDPPPQYD